MIFTKHYWMTYSGECAEDEFVIGLTSSSTVSRHWEAADRWKQVVVQQQSHRVTLQDGAASAELALFNFSY